MTLLAVKPGDTIFEGTAGEGGLTFDIAKALGKKGTLITTDLDKEMLSRTTTKLGSTLCDFYPVNDNFRNVASIAERLKVAKIDGLVLDLGFASYHVDESGRGFTFQKDEPLFMTLGSDVENSVITALDVVNEWSEESLANIIYGFGGERKSRKLASAIVDARKVKRIETTKELKEIVEGVLGSGRRGGIHPATLVFQAIRMAVNDELGALAQALTDGFELMSSDARMVVISFHEGEDRLVKRFMRAKSGEGKAKILTKKPVTPSVEELADNPRSRSAKLRALVKN